MRGNAEVTSQTLFTAPTIRSATMMQVSVIALPVQAAVRTCVVFVTLLTFVIAATPSDAASPSRKKAIWGPVVRDGVSQFPIYRDLGVGIYQSTLRWSDVAPRRPSAPTDPNDPAYSWPAELDIAAAEAERYGIRIALMVMGTPGWANGGRDPRWAPTDPEDFAQFVAAASRRYPSIRLWMIWGEPTKPANFQPLSPDRGGRLRGRALRGPRRYSQLLDAAYGSLKRVSRRNVVIGGNTWTAGTVRPRSWINALRLPGGRRPRMDLYGHNPFSVRPPRLSGRPIGNGYADFADLDTLAGWLDRAFGARRRLKLFLSEYSLPTGHANHEFNFYVGERTQARWIRIALRETRRWSRIYSFGYLGLYDDPVRPGGDQVERGLLRRDGSRKPSYAAYREG